MTVGAHREKPVSQHSLIYVTASENDFLCWKCSFHCNL